MEGEANPFVTGTFQIADDVLDSMDMDRGGSGIVSIYGISPGCLMII